MSHLQWGKAACVTALKEGRLQAFTDEQLTGAVASDREILRAAKVNGTWANAGPPAQPPPTGWRRDRG